ncbi:MAG: NAD-dependent epimerase/dehydratase family protein [Brumimicrobium sp.]
MRKILVIGAAGQIGNELVLYLENKFGRDAVIASDLKEECPEQLIHSNYESLDVLDKDRLKSIIDRHKINEVYLLAALLSVTAEKNPMFAWELNMNGLFNVLNLAKEGYIKKVFWPSSIAAFGPTTPKVNTPQHTIMEPTTVYGISKKTGEQWCEYYFNNYGVDVRSIRYPGLISYKTLPGGGTTDYAVDIFYHAKQNQTYTAFLSEDTALPMMFMDDAIRATVELMEAPAENIKIRTSYNLGGISFTPKELAAAIKLRIPNFEMKYNPDERQAIADSWPQSIDDTRAKEDWNWENKFNLSNTVDIMLENVEPKKYFKS